MTGRKVPLRSIGPSSDTVGIPEKSQEHRRFRLPPAGAGKDRWLPSSRGQSSGISSLRGDQFVELRLPAMKGAREPP